MIPRQKKQRSSRYENVVTRLFDKFGGISAAARALEIPVTTADHWKKRGFIPPQRINEVREVAFRMGIGLSAADFIPDFEPKATKAKDEEKAA